MGEIKSCMEVNSKASSGCDPAWQGAMNWWWALLKLDYNTHTHTHMHTCAHAHTHVHTRAHTHIHWDQREDESEQVLLQGFIIASSDSGFLGQFLMQPRQFQNFPPCWGSSTVRSEHFNLRLGF